MRTELECLKDLDESAGAHPAYLAFYPAVRPELDHAIHEARCAETPGTRGTDRAMVRERIRDRLGPKGKETRYRFDGCPQARGGRAGPRLRRGRRRLTTTGAGGKCPAEGLAAARPGRALALAQMGQKAGEEPASSLSPRRR